MTKTNAGHLAWLAVVMAFLAGGVARAQDKAWVQIEAKPTLAEALERARAYTSVFPDVAGYTLRSGFYGIVLGPYSSEEAAVKLLYLRREGLIAPDSFMVDASSLRDRFWPDWTLPPAALPDPDPMAEPIAPEAEAAPAPLVPAPADETPDEARATEAALTGPQRKDLQTALQWFGFYSAAIDGVFGSGTRKAMTAWQEANAQDATGILTTAQRATVVSAYRSAMAELGLQRVTETEAGIEIDLPMAMIRFDRYEPPFAR